MTEETLEIPAGCTSGKVDPALARALVNAQASAHSLAKDGTNTQAGYAYTTSEQIAAEARRVLNAAGLEWSRMSSKLRAPVLVTADIGNRSYVGDVVIEWRLTYSVTGAYIEGVSEVPIVTSKRTPHDKAVKASETYGSGYVLLGLLCLDRDGDNGVDSRREPDQSQDPRDLVRHALDAKLELYMQAFGVPKGRAWSEALMVGGHKTGTGGDDGPWSSVFSESDLRQMLDGLTRAMAT